jgi:hypothetical protein
MGLRVVDETGVHKHNRDGASCLLQGRDHGRTFANNDIWFQLRQLGCVSPETVVIAGSPAILNPNVAPFAPTQLLKPVPGNEGCDGNACSLIAVRVPPWGRGLPNLDIWAGLRA